jgi:hypothetical protein
MCKNHPNYQAKRKPRADCLECWMEFIRLHPDAMLAAKDVNKILFLFSVKLSQLESYTRSEIAHLQSYVPAFDLY